MHFPDLHPCAEVHHLQNIVTHFSLSTVNKASKEAFN